MIKFYSFDEIFSVTDYPDGNQRVAIVPGSIPLTEYKINVIAGFVRCTGDLFTLALAQDAYRSHHRGLSFAGESRINWMVPYLPNAREDRRPGKGVSSPLQMMRNMIDGLGLDITIIDPHSVAVADFENVSFAELFIAAIKQLEGTDEVTHIIQPDSGAKLRSAKASIILYRSQQALPHEERPEDAPEIVKIDKERSPVDGKLSIGYSGPPVEAGKYWLCDDICDGGGTFIGSAESLWANLAEGVKPADVEMTLFITHGLFTQGVTKLFERFSRIITLDCYKTPALEDLGVEFINLSQALNTIWRTI